jgi:transcription initiation factor IIE alpha subunit
MKLGQKLRLGLTPVTLQEQQATPAAHTFACPICGGIVDRRDLGQMMLHERPAHRSRRVDREMERQMERRISGG